MVEDNLKLLIVAGSSLGIYIVLRTLIFPLLKRVAKKTNTIIDDLFFPFIERVPRAEAGPVEPAVGDPRVSVGPHQPGGPRQGTQVILEFGVIYNIFSCDD